MCLRGTFSAFVGSRLAGVGGIKFLSTKGRQSCVGQTPLSLGFCIFYKSICRLFYRHHSVSAGNAEDEEAQMPKLGDSRGDSSGVTWVLTTFLMLGMFPNRFCSSHAKATVGQFQHGVHKLQHCMSEGIWRLFRAA